MLAELYPAGAAGGYHRQFAAVFDALEKLRTLLHYREVSAGVSVEYTVKAHAPKGRCHLAGDGRTHRIAEFLAEGGSYSGSGLHDYIL